MKTAARRRYPEWMSADMVFVFLAVILSSVLLWVDSVARFYEGDSTAYLSTGLDHWIPPDRSWAYGYLSRWTLCLTHSIGALLIVQALAYVAALSALQRRLPSHRGVPTIPPVMACLMVLDPLNQTYIRFWLSDLLAEAAFLGFLAALLIAAGRRSTPATLTVISMAAAATFIRVAYAPIMLLTLLLYLLASFRDDLPSPKAFRIRLALLCLAPILSVPALAVANSHVSIPRLRGQLFVNRMSGLYTMGVFLPGLRYDDFRRAGIALSRQEFGDLHLQQYDRREMEVWGDGPVFVRSLIQDRLHMPDVYGVAFQQRCRAVVRSALVHHPQTLISTYLWSFVLYLSPEEWRRVAASEMGADKPLPDWVAHYLSWQTRETISPEFTRRSSLVPAVLKQVIVIYPIVLIVGSLCSIGLLLRRRPLDAMDLFAGAMLASLALAPLYSHAVKPRYVLSSVTLSEWIIVSLIGTGVRTVVARPRIPPGP